MAKSDDERLEISSPAELRRWLKKHFRRPEGVWLVSFKKHCGDRYVSWPEIVQELLCFGWIDSQTRTLDEDRSMIWISPRKAGSMWSRINKEHVETMVAQGRMTPAGLERIEEAKRDGSWTLLDDVEAGVVPDDLAAALDGDAEARANFDAFTPSQRKGFLWWVKSAKRERTRADRIANTVRCAARNIKEPRKVAE